MPIYKYIGDICAIFIFFLNKKKIYLICVVVIVIESKYIRLIPKYITFSFFELVLVP